MICKEILGKSTDREFENKKIDYLDLEWDEAFKRRQRKLSRDGEDVGISMGDEILKTGLRGGDVLFSDERKIIVVNILKADAIELTVSEDSPHQIAKLCYEVGNTHTTMFRGEDLYTFYVPYNKTLFDKLSKLDGVHAKKVLKSFDFNKALSNSINDHHH